MPPLSRVNRQPTSAGDWGKQAMPGMQMQFTPTQAVGRGQGPTFASQMNTDFVQKYSEPEDPERPYKNVGKMAVNLASPEAWGPNAPRAQGLLEGFGAGAGRLIGGVVGQEQAGADIGQFLGRGAQIPIDAAAGILGALPAIPGLPGGGVPGGTLFTMPEADRKKFLDEWDGNPFGLMKAIGDYDKESWQKRIDSGEVSAVFRALGPSSSLGDQLMNTLGIMGIPSDMIQRGWAGGPGDAIKRMYDTPDEELNPELLALREAHKAGTLSDEMFLDQMVVNGAGYSNNWVLNLLGSAVLDPANLMLGAGTAMGLATKGAKAARALSFVDNIGDDAMKSLARSVSEQATLKGTSLAEEAVTPLQMMEEAQRLGTHGEQLAAATRALPARQQLALHPAFAKMETVADVTSKVLDPTNMIGRRGTKPITNAYLSREATKGVAQAYGLNNYSTLSDRLAQLGKGDLFDDGIGYFGAQESVLMAGDSLKSDIEHVRRVSSARPTDVAMARAKVGAENYAFKMERWIGKRKADLAMLTGGTKEEAMSRARTHASDRLTRMGLSADEAAGVIKGLDEDGLSLIDAMYFGHRIKTYNVAKRAAREAVAAKIANRKGGVANKADIALQDTVDRTTLIGPRELTDLRAGLLREALDAGDIVAVRNAVRQYDRLAYQFLADQGDDQVLINGVREWLDEFEGGLTKELDADALSKMPDAIRNDAARGDGYVYGLRPADGDPEWRLSFYGEDDLERGVKAGDIKGANPWIDIVGDPAEPWNMKFRDKNTRVSSFANTVERASRFMGQQITTDRIDREARRRFIDRAMVKPVRKDAAAGTTGLTYAESRDLYEAVKKRALEAGTAPRGMNISEFQQIIDGSSGAKRVGVSARDLQLLTLQSFEGNVGTVGLTQKLTGIAKTQGSDIPLLPENTLGQMAERMFPLVRFSLNPIFQLQEWVEPWVFGAARGQQARLTGTWTNPLDGSEVTLDQVDLIQKHMMERYRASNPESQFDMMERSLVYLYGQKAAKEAAAATDQNMLRRALSTVATAGGAGSAGQRKQAAQSEMFRYFLGPMLKEQFDKINPNIWIGLEREFGTKDAGKIAVRWLTEKDKWASADPRVAYHLMDASKEPAMGARAAVNLEQNAQHVFSSSREALNTRVIDGSLTKTEFEDTMRELGAHDDYIARTWKVMQFEAKTGGVDKWWDDALPLVAGGANEIKAVRTVVKALADVAGISETELLSRTMQNSPMSLMHDDFISLAENDLAAYGVLLQQQKDMVKHVRVDPVTGGVTVQRVPGITSDMELLHAWQNPPASIPVEQHGNILKMEEVRFGEGGRTLFVPGGVDALNDLETPWTAWEAHVIRSQILNPNDLKDPALKHALDEKMWRGHTIDMADPTNVHAVFNNYMFAMHSAQMSLTRNEMVATRFRVSSLDDLKDLAAEGRDLRATIEASGSTSPLENDLGLAYSTKVGVSHYIPLDDMNAHITAGMLPERTTTEMVGGVPTPKNYRSTESLIRERADAASRYLRGTSAAQRAETAKIDALHKEAEKVYKPGPGQPKSYHTPGAMENWAIDQIAEALFKGGIEAIDGKAGVKGLTETFGVKRLASIKPEDQAALLEAAGKLQENPLDLKARAVVGQYTTTWKGYDENVIFKPWNVNGAGRTPAKNVDGSPIFHGDSDVFAYLKNDDVSWRGTATSANMGNSLLMAQDMADNPAFYTRRTYADGTLEPLDEFGERISHRTRGLSLKTGFFGTDLGDPMNFNRGVHDLHMVGDMTEWMYYVKGANGTNAEWTKWMNRLSKAKQDQINKWIAKGAPKGAGVYKWSEAIGAEISFKPGKADRAIAESGGVAGKAAWVRRRLDEAVASTEPNKAAIGQAQRDRMGRMYRTDEEWAELFDRDIKMFGGDYQVFEETMSIRKAEAEAVPGPEADGLKRHGNGGYQWKLWDERRHIWDPETTAFATSHSMPRRDIRYYASSDDAHNVAGFFKNEGQPSVEEAGYSALDPWNTIMPQTDGRRIRGATILTDTGERIIGLTQYRNRSTFLHEITHAVVEPLLMDDSLKRVVYNDLNEVIAERNAAMIARTGELKTQVDEITNTIIDHENALITAKSTQDAAQKEAKTAASALKVAEAEAAKLEEAVPRQQGVLAQLKKDAPAKRKEAATRKYPSDRKDALERIEAALVREQKKLDDLIASRDAATAKVEPARIVNTYRSDAAAEAAEQTRIIQTNLTARKSEGYALKLEYDKIATQMPESQKFGWDAAVSEHFADEFAKWLATGKAKNPKMRDAFAYFRNVLVRIFNWAPKDKVSPEMQKLFEDLTTPQVAERVTTANAVPFDATEEMMHAAGIQSVVDAEDAAFTNVQFRRKRSWLERSVNHPYFGIYPASYMWGKVAPEMVRSLAANPFGMPIPILSKPVKINGVEYGLHGSPFMGYANAMRVQNSVEMQKDTDPEFAAAVNDSKNAQVWRNMMMFLPATPWDIPANFPLWQRRIAEWGLESQEEVATARAAGQEPSDITPLNVNKLGSEIVSYAFGPKATFDWLDDMVQLPKAPALGGEASEGVTPESLKVTPAGIVPVEQQLQEASAQLQNSLGQ